MNNTRGRVHLNERRESRSPILNTGAGRYWPKPARELFSLDYELPDAPENPDFESLHTEAQASAIETRFRDGIELREIYDARAARLAREASIECHKRFHKPRRPDRKQRALTAKLGDIAPRAGRR